MAKIKRILFIAENVTLAHVTRLIVLASALNNKTFEIIFATGQQAVKLVESASFVCHAIPTLSSETFINRLAKGHRVYTSEELKASVETDLTILRQVSPDIVIGDFRLSLGISAPLAHIPFISIVNAHWSPYSSAKIPFPEHPMTCLFGVPISEWFFDLLQPLIFNYHALPFNKVRKIYGLAPLSSLQEAYTYGDWTLYPDIPELAPTSPLPVTHRYIGPVLWSPDIPLPEWWDKIQLDTRPLIYLTLGSSGNIKIMDVLLSLLTDMPVIVIISTANRFNQKDHANNIFYANYLPGQKMADAAALVICNGGSATTYQALASGTPVLGFPSNTDQHFTMNAVTLEGAGLSIRSDQVKENEVRNALHELINNSSYRDNAIRIKDQLAQYNAPLNFLHFIQSLDL